MQNVNKYQQQFSFSGKTRYNCYCGRGRHYTKDRPAAGKVARLQEAIARKIYF